MSGVAPEAPRVGLYQGSTWHRRHGRVDHRFRYRVWSVLVDLDELPALGDRRRLLAVDAPAPVSLRSVDHVLPLDAASVREWLAERGVDVRGGRIRLLTSPRFLGAVFNPLSLWWCYDDRGALTAVIAEVHNTYGGRHAYLLRPDGDGRAATVKRLHVSPFYPVEGGYELRLSASADRFAVHVGYGRADRRVFEATWTGRQEPLTDRALLSMLWRNPLWSLRVRTLIHWRGIRLWLRLPVFPRRPEDRHDLPTPPGPPTPPTGAVPRAPSPGDTITTAGANR